MTIYEALSTENKQPSCLPPPSICCKEPCDEPSIWDSLSQCRLNWIALGLAAFAIGFGLIGLGYINIGTTINLSTIDITFNPVLIAQGSRLIAIFLGVILVSAWILFKTCSDDWKIVVVGSLIGASGFPLAAIGLVYETVAQLPSGFDPTWFSIAKSLLVASILGFLFFAYLLYSSRCHGCISAKKGVVVSLIFLSAGWASWSLGRLLWAAVTTFAFSKHEGLASLPPPSGYNFPSSAFGASIAVSVANIVLALALGWYTLGCAAENCFTIFLPLFASAAPLGNWALYRVGLHVFSYGNATFPPTTPLTQLAVVTGSVSIIALLLSIVIASGNGDVFVTAVVSAIFLLYAIAIYTYVSTATGLTGATPPDFVTSMLQGILYGITLTAVLAFLLKSQATCPIPRIIYGFASGIFGWAVIYLYSTYSANFLDLNGSSTPPSITTLNIGLKVIIGAVIVAVLYVRFISTDELLSAITFTNIALLTVGVAGFTGTVAYYHSELGSANIRASVIIYATYVLIALLLPRFFVKCGGIKRQLVIAIAALAFGIAAIDFGRAVVFARAVAYVSGNSSKIDFSTLIYIASVVVAVLAGQGVVWAYPQANLNTALIAIGTGTIAGGIAQQVSFFVEGVSSDFIREDTGLIGTPWLIFTLVLVGLLVFLEHKSLCIPQHCRFLVGLLIPALGIAVFGKVAGASAALGTAYNSGDPVSFLPVSAFNPRIILVNAIIPLASFLISLQAFNCTSCFAYLPSCIAHIGVVYVVSQFELPDLAVNNVLSPARTVAVPPPFLNPITSIYFWIDFSITAPAVIADNVAFITQVSLVYILFLAPSLIAAFALSCSKPLSSAVIGAAIVATAISFGAFGIAIVISGVLEGISFISISITDTFITFAQFLTGISSQFALLAVGVLTVLFILFDKCSYRSC